MKKSFYIILLTMNIFSSCQSNVQVIQTNKKIAENTDTTIQRNTTVVISNKTALKEISLCRYPIPGLDNECLLKISDSKEISINGRYELFFSSDNMINFVVKATDSVEVIPVKEKSIQYSFSVQKDKLRNNEINFFVVAREKKMPLMLDRMLNQYLKLYNEKELLNNIKKIRKLYLSNVDFADYYFKSYEVSELFKKYVYDFLRFDHYVRIFENIKPRGVIDSLIQAKYFDESISENPYNVSNRQYYIFLILKGEYCTRSANSRPIDIHETFKRYNSNFSPAQADYLKFFYISTHIDSLNNLYNDSIEKVIAEVNNASFREVLLTKNRNLAINKTGNDQFIDTNNIKYSFSDIVNNNKGKIIFIDFWASWCGPCRSEFKHYSDLRAIFKEKEISFAFVSIDNARGPWLRALDTEGLNFTEDNFLLPNPSRLFIKTHKLESIPRYAIYDKKGKLFLSDAPRPSDPKLVPMLRKLLQ